LGKDGGVRDKSTAYERGNANKIRGKDLKNFPPDTNKTLEISYKRVKEGKKRKTRQQLDKESSVGNWRRKKGGKRGGEHAGFWGRNLLLASGKKHNGAKGHERKKGKFHG